MTEKKGRKLSEEKCELQSARLSKLKSRRAPTRLPQLRAVVRTNGTVSSTSTAAARLYVAGRVTFDKLGIPLTRNVIRSFFVTDPEKKCIVIRVSPSFLGTLDS